MLVNVLFASTLTGVSERGGHSVGPSSVAGQAAVYPSILFLHIFYDQRATRGHPVSKHRKYQQYCNLQ